MDTKMDVDVGKTPEPHQLSPITESATIPTLDGWIESLMNCKQLAENDVRRLCDRVCQGFKTYYVPHCSLIPIRRGKFYKRSRMYSLWYEPSFQVHLQALNAREEMSSHCLR